nr:MAG TPA: hypothetical protein [Caudoviricetes sp.]
MCGHKNGIPDTAQDWYSSAISTQPFHRPAALCLFPADYWFLQSILHFCLILIIASKGYLSRPAFISISLSPFTFLPISDKIVW